MVWPTSTIQREVDETNAGLALMRELEAGLRGRSEAEREQVRSALAVSLRQVAPTTRHELWEFVRHEYGIFLPYTRTSDDTHTIFDWFADVYQGREDANFTLLWAARGSGKSFSCGLLHHANLLFKSRCHTLHTAFHLDQAEDCWNVVSDLVRRGAGGEQMERCILKETIASNGALLNVRAATLAGVAGPHPDKAFADEADFWKWQVLQQFLSCAMERPQDGEVIYEPQTAFLTARQSPLGTLDALLDRAEELGLRIYRCPVWTFMQPCGHCVCKSGSEVFPDRCKLWEDCRGEKALKLPTGFRSREEMERLRQRTDEDTWQSQHLCERPALQGLMYSSFLPQDVSLGGNLRRHKYDPELPILLGIDEGTGAPYAVEMVQPLPDGRLQWFDEIYDEGQNDTHAVKRMFCELMVAKDYRTVDGKLNWPQGSWIDPSAAAGMIEWRSARDGMPSLNVNMAPRGGRGPTAFGTVADGTRRMRAWIGDASRQRRALVDPEGCPKLLWERAHYMRRARGQTGTFEEAPADGQADHAEDASRYLLDGWEIAAGMGMQRGV